MIIEQRTMSSLSILILFSFVLTSYLSRTARMTLDPFHIVSLTVGCCPLRKSTYVHCDPCGLVLRCGYGTISNTAWHGMAWKVGEVCNVAMNNRDTNLKTDGIMSRMILFTFKNHFVDPLLAFWVELDQLILGCSLDTSCSCIFLTNDTSHSFVA